MQINRGGSGLHANTYGGVMRVYLLLPFLAACARSGLGKTDLDTGEIEDTDVPAGLQDCPWVGTWNLAAVQCGTFEFPDWYETHDAASMVIDHDPAGGCSVVTTITS